MIGSIQRLDSDRYLRNVYSWVTSKYAYSTSVFLGDLIDEGSIATDDEFDSYVQRFLSIFPPDSTKSSIYTPGDNDVGGEGVDRVTLQKIQRFQNKFGTSKHVVPACSFLDIVPVSRLTEHGYLNITSKIEHISRDKIVVVISHVPVLPLKGRFAERIMSDLNPDIIFSAHDHRGFLFSGKRGSLKASQPQDMVLFSKDEDITPVKIQTRQTSTDGTVEMSETMTEIVVPTCSYRMGVKEMGLGLAVFSRSGEVAYYNLWVPSRFPLLYLYLTSAVSVLVLAFIGKCIDIRKLARRRSELQHHYRRNYNALL